MTQEAPTGLPSWERPHFAPCDGEAFLIFVAFGDIDTSQPLSSSKYRCSGIADDFQVTGYDRVTYPQVFENFLSGFLWERLQEEDPDLARQVEKSGSCIVVRLTRPNSATLDYLRDTVGVLTWMLDHGGLAIYDPEAFRWWSPPAWREEIFDPAGPVPRNHVVILLSEEEADPELVWIHTRGLRKFGRPDVSVHNVPERHQDGVIEMINRFIEYQGFGGVIPEGEAIRMAAVPAGGVARHGGDVEDPDFNNVHVEIVWPGAGLASCE
jgi:hypothetical protein